MPPVHWVNRPRTEISLFSFFDLCVQVMQFGRIDSNAYTLDFQYPFTALQAFAVALANVTQRLKWACQELPLTRISFSAPKSAVRWPWHLPVPKLLRAGKNHDDASSLRLGFPRVPLHYSTGLGYCLSQCHSIPEGTAALPAPLSSVDTVHFCLQLLKHQSESPRVDYILILTTVSTRSLPLSHPGWRSVIMTWQSHFPFALQWSWPSSTRPLQCVFWLSSAAASRVRKSQVCMHRLVDWTFHFQPKVYWNVTNLQRMICVTRILI